MIIIIAKIADCCAESKQTGSLSTSQMRKVPSAAATTRGIAEEVGQRGYQ